MDTPSDEPAINATTVRDRQESRFKVLKRTYELSGADSMTSVSEEAIARGIGIPLDDIDPLVKYLCDRGLLDIPHFGRYVSITERGITEVETFISNPARGSEHFKFASVTNHFHGQVGVAQTGVNTATVTMNSGVPSSDLVALLGQLRTLAEAGPPEKRAELLAEVEDLESDLNAPTRKANWLGRVTGTLTRITGLGTGLVGLVEIVDQLRAAIEKFR